MASLSDNPDKEASRWFVIILVGAFLYVGAAYFFVVSVDVEPTEDQINRMASHD